MPSQPQPVTIDLNRASDLVEKRCSNCHNLDRVLGARKDAQGWLATVDRMRKIPGSGITEADAQTIVSYLASQSRPQGPESNGKTEVARALVDQRCGRGHSLDRVYKTVQTGKSGRLARGTRILRSHQSHDVPMLGHRRPVRAYPLPSRSRHRVPAKRSLHKQTRLV